jgi:signal transduction histidine kinase
MEPLAAAKALGLMLQVQPGGGLHLISDERKIRQIVTNLLSNAVKFTDRGQVTVRAAVEEHTIRIDVTDTGIGIPAHLIGHIFDPFWQVEPASTRRFGGTGLGLGVARKLAQLLGGRLEVVSAEGAGSTFTLLLPRQMQVVPARQDDAASAGALSLPA